MERLERAALLPHQLPLGLERLERSWSDYCLLPNAYLVKRVERTPDSIRGIERLERFEPYFL